MFLKNVFLTNLVISEEKKTDDKTDLFLILLTAEANNL